MLDWQSNGNGMWGSFLYAPSLPVKRIRRTATKRESSAVGAGCDIWGKANRPGTS